MKPFFFKQIFMNLVLKRYYDVALELLTGNICDYQSKCDEKKFEISKKKKHDFLCIHSGGTTL